jgi:hypothetical protein
VDEATTVHEVGLSLGSMLHEIRLNETTPPLYFLVAWVWTHAFGTSELGIRSLSALAGTALVPVAYACGRELVTARAGVVAAALTAVSPFMIWYSQEARSYAILALFAGLSVLFWGRAGRTGRTADLVCWSAAAALAVLTHFFAGFLVAPEALWLLWRVRRRACWVSVALVGAAQAAVLPLALGDTSHPLGWITLFPLSTRIEQIPVAFAGAELYKSPAIGWGLPGAAIVGALAVVLLWRTGGRRERRGAAHVTGLAAFALGVPVAVALAGHDYVFARNFIPAWLPLAVALAGACTGHRDRWAGGALAAVLLVGFLWAGFKIADDPAYQRPDWRGAASALGTGDRPRAIVAFDGNAAEQPLSVYLRTPFSYSGRPESEQPVRVSEVDVVGDADQAMATRLPPGVRLIERRIVNNILVVRFELSRAWILSPAGLAARAGALVGPATGRDPAVLIQR